MSSNAGAIGDDLREVTLTEAKVRLTMDNIFIERLRRSLKYEAVYLQDIADGFAAQRIIDDWIHFYRRDRPHTRLLARRRLTRHAEREPNSEKRPDQQQGMYLSEAG